VWDIVVWVLKVAYEPNIPENLRKVIEKLEKHEKLQMIQLIPSKVCWIAIRQLKTTFSQRVKVSPPLS